MDPTDNMTADEAHKPHETEVAQWRSAFQADPLTAMAKMPSAIRGLLTEELSLEGTEQAIFVGG